MKTIKLIAILTATLIAFTASAQETKKNKTANKKEQARKDKEKAKKRKKLLKEYQKTSNGLYYKFHVQNKDSVKPQVDEFVTISMIYRDENDSVIFDSRSVGQKMEFPVVPSTFKGSFEEALMMMGVGDSASFLINGDSLYIKTFGFEQLPPEIEKGSLLRFDVKLLDIRTKEDIEKEQMEQFMQEMAKLEQRKFEEPGAIAKYIEESKITVKPTESGLYFVEREKGNGPKIETGDTVFVHYTGKFLDGQVFDSSVGQEPLEMVAGIGMVIPGWDEALLMMNVGGKATLVIPSELAYGERGVGEGLIPPYTPLLFDVEVMSIRKGQK